MKDYNKFENYFSEELIHLIRKELENCPVKIFTLIDNIGLPADSFKIIKLMFELNLFPGFKFYQMMGETNIGAVKNKRIM